MHGTVRKPLTPAARRVLRAIYETEKYFKWTRGAGFQEVCDRADRSIGTVQDHVKWLIENGYVEKRAKYYGLHAIVSPIDGSDCPEPLLYGDVAAGPPIDVGPDAEYGQIFALTEPDEDAHELVLDRDFLEHHALKGDVLTITHRDALPGEWELDGGVVTQVKRRR